MTVSVRFALVSSLLVACIEGQPPPVDPATCEPPTWEECAAPVTACDRYFREQARTEPRSACNLLFEQRAAAEAFAYPEREVVVPRLSRAVGLPRNPTTPTAMARVVPVNRDSFSFRGLDGLELGATYRDAALVGQSGPDAAARRLLRTQTRMEWEANGDKVMSCREYTHERFFDYTRFEDRAIDVGLDAHRAIYEVAYSSESPPPTSAIGTRHLVDPTLRSRDGRAFGTLPFAEEPLPKNRYFTVPAPRSGTRVSFMTGTDDRVIYLPASRNVIVQLAHLDKVDRTGLDHAGVRFEDPELAATIDAGRAYYDESWAWHQEMATRNAPVLDEILYAHEHAQDDFVALLDERTRLAETLASLLDPGAASAVPVAGGNRLSQTWWLDPLWNPDPTSVASASTQVVDVRDVSLGGIAGLINHPTTSGILQYAAPPLGASAEAPSVRPLQRPQVVQACTGNPIICAAYRLAALDGVIEEELLRARDEGCLDVAATTGPAPCDWSPRRFAQSVLGHFRTEREVAFQKCDEYTTSFEDLEDRELSFTNPDSGESFYAREDYTVSGVALEQYYEDVDDYLDVVGGYLGPLLDRSSGEVRLKRDVSDEAELGGDLFGARFGYRLAFEATDVGNEDTCAIEQRAAASMEVEATLMGVTEPVFDADIDVSDHVASLSARVLGEELISGATTTNLDTVTVIRGQESTTERFIDESVTIVVGFVPITLGGAVVGGVGVGYGLEAGRETTTSGGCQLVRSGVTGQVMPVAWVQAEAYAAVDAVVAEAGIKGILTLVLAQLPIDAVVAIQPDPDSPSELDFVLSTAGALRLTFFSGSISVYLEVGVCPICTSWEEPLVAWDGLRDDIPLFETEATVRLADLRLLVNRQGQVP